MKTLFSSGIQFQLDNMSDSKLIDLCRKDNKVMSKCDEDFWEDRSFKRLPRKILRMKNFADISWGLFYRIVQRLTSGIKIVQLETTEAFRIYYIFTLQHLYDLYEDYIDTKYSENSDERYNDYYLAFEQFQISLDEIVKSNRIELLDELIILKQYRGDIDVGQLQLLTNTIMRTANHTYLKKLLEYDLSRELDIPDIPSDFKPDETNKLIESFEYLLAEGYTLSDHLIEKVWHIWICYHRNKISYTNIDEYVPILQWLYHHNVPYPSAKDFKERYDQEGISIRKYMGVYTKIYKAMCKLE